MFKDEKILVGKNKKTSTYILPSMANRHGLITGASGSGKTVTMKVLAESFSDAGVPVFLADVKGDVGGTCLPGTTNEKLQGRIDSLGLTDDFKFKGYPVVFWDVYAKGGHPVRTSIKSVGPTILSNMLGLSEAQEGVLAIAFKVAEDQDLELIDLKDLRLVLQYIGDNAKDFTISYGNVAQQSVGAIQRSILMLQQQGGDSFFGEPEIDINDFIKQASDGRGNINILHCVELYQQPDLYSSFLLWLLTSLSQKLPEVGDLAKPKIVFFFDEAHLLFDDMPSYLKKQVTQVVKLIRSKGIGLYFISQQPTDVPDDILAQLGNRVQHTLRAYTPQEQKVVKAAAMAFRTNPAFDTEKAILELGTGEALVSFTTEKGEPSVVEKVTILPPQSDMNAIDDGTRLMVMARSEFKGKYDTLVDRESAYEKISAAIKEREEELEELRAQQEEEKKKLQEEKEAEKAKKEEEKKQREEEKAAEKLRKEEEKARKEEERLKKEEERKKAQEEKEAEKAKKNNPVYKLGKKATNKAVNKVLDKGLNKLFKGLFK